MKKKNLFWKLYPLLLGLFFVGLLGFIFISKSSFREFYRYEKVKALTEKSGLTLGSVTPLLTKGEYNQLRSYVKQAGIDANNRITVIDREGKVISDSNFFYRKLPNLIERPEFAGALQGKIAVEQRVSERNGDEYLFVARPIFNDDREVIGALRHSISFIHMKALYSQYLGRNLGSFVLVSLLAAVLLAYISRSFGFSLQSMQKMAEKFSQGNFTEKLYLDHRQASEIYLLGKALNDMGEKLDKQMQKIIRQKNERESIFSSMGEGVLSVYMDGNIFHLNEAVCQLFEVGYEERTYKGKPLLETFREKFLSDFFHKVLREHVVVEEELVLRGGQKILQVHGSMLKNAANEDLGVLMVFTDVTRIRELENHRKEFIDNIGHELRTPLTSIHGYAETLLDCDDLEMDTKNKFLEVIRKNSMRLSQIVEDLMILSQLDKFQHGDGLSTQTVKATALVQEAIDITYDRSGKQDIVIDVQCDQGVMIQVNPGLIQQAVVNMVSNALRYGPEGKPITIRLECQAEDLLIHVIDCGKGIPKSERSRIFERFYSVSKARSRSLGGSGLGLSIVKNVATAHGGDVCVGETSEGWCQFTLKLPSVNRLT